MRRVPGAPASIFFGVAAAACILYTMFMARGIMNRLMLAVLCVWLILETILALCVYRDYRRMTR